jgi:glycosyltransferase involved in cell wall biosynthesis
MVDAAHTGTNDRRLTVMQLVPALDAGGAERSTLEMADALVRAGHRAVVVSAGGRWLPQLEQLGAEHLKLDLSKKSLTTLMKAGVLRSAIARVAPDIVHARSRLPAWVARIAMRGLRRRPHFVTTVHGLNSPGFYSRVMTTGERVICVSQTVHDYVRRHYPQIPVARLMVIPRGIDPDAFPFGYQHDGTWRQRFAAEFPTLADRPLIVMPGRGTRLKGHHDAIRALARLRTTYAIDARLMLLGVVEAGREDYLAELDALARELGARDAVVFSPARADVREIFASSVCVLQLSNKPEAFGRTVVEALGLGVPVVGYAHGGVGELLAELYPHGAVALGDVDGVAFRIRSLIDRPVPVVRDERYTLAAMQEATLQVYADVCG